VNIAPDVEAETLGACRLFVADEPIALSCIAGGIINRTYQAEYRDGLRIVMQHVSSAIPRDVVHDIDCVMRHLAAHDVPSPQLLRTLAGDLTVTSSTSGRWWRAFSHVHGLRHPLPLTLPAARSAACLVGRFHRALHNFAEPLQSTLPPIHRPDAYFGQLRQVRTQAHASSEGREIVELASEILDRACTVTGASAHAAAPKRLCHGDLGISNLLFSPDLREARYIVDFDTLARMPLMLEMGDALRSWCSRLPKSDQSAAFDLSIFDAALRDYARETAGLFEAAELASVPLGVSLVTLELAARFCIDAYFQNYFAWDSSLYVSAREHNVIRTRQQLELHALIETQRDDLTEIASGLPGTLTGASGRAI
jgi:Ser/Thr protein kinase RdoA (MazF antagonist)